MRELHGKERDGFSVMGLIECCVGQCLHFRWRVPDYLDIDLMAIRLSERNTGLIQSILGKLVSFIVYFKVDGCADYSHFIHKCLAKSANRWEKEGHQSDLRGTL